MVFLTPSTFVDTSFEVISVDRKSMMAFRLGSEIVDTMVVSREGKRYTITLSAQHTICGPVKKFGVGDKVTINKSEIHEGDKVSRDSIRIVN